MNRLKEIAKYVKGDVVADIGTDHAHLLIDLVQQDKIKKGIACDLNKQPLESAMKNISNAGLKDSIETLLSNGLQNLEVHVDEIVIAGLGQNTIEMILDEGKDKLPNRIIICSNTVANKVRELMKQLKYFVEFEKIIIDNSKYYELIIFNNKEGLEIKDLFLGDYNINNMDNNFKEYINKRLLKYKQIIEYNKDSEYKDIIKKIEELI